MAGIKRSGSTNIKDVVSFLGIDENDANELLRRIKNDDYSSPHELLTWVNDLLDIFPHWAHGVEITRVPQDPFSGDVWLEYVNRGDTYAPTVIFDHKHGTWGITTWGDIVEKNNGRPIIIPKTFHTVRSF